MATSVERAARPGRYVAGRLICAINVGSVLAERGIKGTGSALAMSYLKLGRASARCRALWRCRRVAAAGTSRSTLGFVRLDGCSRVAHQSGNAPAI
jgi:hypothetical protein